MKKKILITTSVVIVLLMVIAGVFGIRTHKKNQELKQRQDSISTLKNQFDSSLDIYDEIQTYETLKIVQEKYPEEFDSFTSTFESKTKQLIKIRDKKPADFLSRLNDIISTSDNKKIQKLSNDLNQLIEENFENMLLSQLKGRWKRQDSSDLSGTVITVNVNGDIPAATITDVSNAVNNKNIFKVGDVKWNYITCVDNSVFTFTDMWKTGEYDITYKQARGIYNYDTDTIDILVGTSDYDGIDTYNGLDQHLVRDTQSE